MSASFVSAMNTRANHFAIDEENKQLKKEVAELMKEKEELLKCLLSAFEKERLAKQTSDLWELLSYEAEHQIVQLINLRGEEYVKEVFAEDYADWKSDSDEESDEEDQ